MSKKKPIHVHKYQRIQWGKNKTVIYRCIIEGCSHYCHPEMVIGRDSLCHECGAKFMMTKDHLERVKPKCAECRGEMIPTSEPPETEAEDFNDLLDRLHEGPESEK